MPTLPGRITPEGVWLPDRWPPQAAGVGPLLGVRSADGTGLSHQEHLFYAVNSARWWLVYPDQIDTMRLRMAWSTDLLTWSDAGSIVLVNDLRNVSAQSDGIGTNLAVAYRNISATDVVHIVYKLRGGDYGVLNLNTAT